MSYSTRERGLIITPILNNLRREIAKVNNEVIVKRINSELNQMLYLIACDVASIAATCLDHRDAADLSMTLIETKESYKDVEPKDFASIDCSSDSGSRHEAFISAVHLVQKMGYDADQLIWRN